MLACMGVMRSDTLSMRRHESVRWREIVLSWTETIQLHSPNPISHGGIKHLIRSCVLPIRGDHWKLFQATTIVPKVLPLASFEIKLPVQESPLASVYSQAPNTIF